MATCSWNRFIKELATYELSLQAGLELPSKTAAACTEVVCDLAQMHKGFLFNIKSCRFAGPATDALIQAAALESAEVVFEFGSG